MKKIYQFLVLSFLSLAAFGQANLQTLPEVIFTAPGVVAKGASSPVILNKIIELVDNTPATDTISMSIYMFNYDPLITALKNADSRGVILRLIIDNSRTDSQDVNASTFTKLATLSANAEVVSFNSDAGSTSINHTKFVLFSKVNTTNGLMSKVLLQTSHNFTSSDSKKLQDALIFNHVGLYNSFWKYFNNIKGRAVSGMSTYAYAEYTDASAGIKACFLPRRTGADNIIEILNNISDVPNAVIKVGMSDWVVSRLNVAQKLVQLSAAGARVEVVVKNKIDAEIQTELLKIRNTGGYLKMYNLVDENDPTINIHAKFMVIEGTYLGIANSKIVVTGSHNFTTNALRYNNEILMILTESSLFGAYKAYFDNIKYVDPPVTVAKWNFFGMAGNEASANVTTTANSLTADPILRGAGFVVSNTLAHGFTSNVGNFSSSSLNKAKANGEYFQFSVNVGLSGNNVLSLYAIDARIRRSGNGNNNYIWAYSLDGNNYTDIQSSLFTITDSNADGAFRPTVDLKSIAALQALAGGSKVYFRLYSWGATTSGGTFAFGKSPNASESSLDISGVVFDILPVEIGAFAAKKEADVVKINWQTLTEKNNASFSLSRSASSSQAFEEIYQVAGQGNKETLTNYQFVDRNPFNGANYYQLKQTDYNGESKVFGPISVHFNLGGANGLSATATSNEIKVNINFDKQQEATLLLYSINGNLITRQNIQLNAGKNNATINTDIPTGVYLLKLQTKNNSLITKFVKPY